LLGLDLPGSIDSSRKNFDFLRSEFVVPDRSMLAAWANPFGVEWREPGLEALQTLDYEPFSKGLLSANIKLAAPAFCRVDFKKISSTDLYGDAGCTFTSRSSVPLRGLSEFTR